MKVEGNLRKPAWENKNGGGFALCLWAKIAATLGILFIAASSPAQAPNFRWVRQSQGNSLNGESVRRLAVDNAGNCFAVGKFESTALTFPGTSVTNTFGAGAYVAKYDRNGNLLWVRQLLGTNSMAYEAAIDGVGNCYVTGYFENYTNTIAGTNLSSQANSRVFIIKYDANGNAVWATQSGTGVAADVGYNVGLDTNGNVYVSGVFTSPTIQFGGTILTNSSSANYENNDFFLVKYDASGRVLWAEQGGPLYYLSFIGVKTDGEGNSYLASGFNGTASFGGLSLAGNNQMCVVKYDSDGNALWAEQASGDGNLSEIAVDTAGNSYLTGVLNSPIAQFGNISLTNTNTGFGLFIAKYDTEGDALWALQVEAPTNDYEDSAYPLGIAVDGAGNSYMVGDINGSNLTFSASTTVTNYIAYTGLSSGFVAKYDSTGHFLWAKGFTGGWGQPGESIASDPRGTLYVAGSRTFTNVVYDNIILTNSFNVTGLIVGQIEGPQLTIQPAGNQVVVSWPTNAAGLGLESASSLNGGGWSPVTNVPVVAGNQNVVTNAVSNGSVFYRLNVQ